MGTKKSRSGSFLYYSSFISVDIIIASDDVPGLV
jgi:hypothetical protein